MGGMKLSELDFLRLLPVFMRDDEAVIALSKAMNRLMGEPGKRLSTIRTWDKIDELNEAECDELAWELDIDWYDSEEMSLEEKRETIKVAQQIKRKRGTKWAVERLVSLYFGDGYVMEWFEPGPGDTICGAAIVGSDVVGAYKGIPFTFSIMTTNPNISSATFEKFVEAVKTAKNERSHITGIYYYGEQGADPGVEYALGSSLHRYDFTPCGTLDRTATVGFLVKPAGIETEPEETLHSYGYNRCGGKGYREVVGTAIVGTAIVGGDFAAIDEIKCGTWPKVLIMGAVSKAEAAAEPTAACIVYGGFTKCGGDGIKSRVAVVGTAIVGTDRSARDTGDNI